MDWLPIAEEMLSEVDGAVGLMVDKKFFPVRLFHRECEIKGGSFPNEDGEVFMRKITKEVNEYIGDNVKGVVKNMHAVIKPRGHLTVTETVVRLPRKPTLRFTFEK